MKWTVVAFALLVPAASYAFVPTQTCTESGEYKCRAGEEPKPVRWKSLCTNWYLNDKGTFRIPAGPDGLVSDALEQTIVTSFDAWNQVECQDLKLVYGGRTDDSRAATDGKANIIVFRDDAWRYASKTAFAITSVTYNPDDGYIVDADMELNSFYHPFTIGDADVEIDVQNTVTHEAGHFLGLDHSFLIKATMFYSAGVGETQKRSLEDDDIEGVCSIYPTEMRTESCDPAPPHTAEDGAADGDSGCCATAPVGPSRAPLALPLILMGWLLARRRARA